MDDSTWLHVQRIRLHDLRAHALNDVIKTAYKKHYRRLVAEGKDLPVVLQEAVAELGPELFQSDTRGRKKDTLTWFITISAKDPVDHYRFLQQMQKCVLKKKLQGTGHYVLEQRSEGSQEPYGWHIHWLVRFESTSSAAVIRQQVYQCFQSFVAGENYVDTKPIYGDTEWLARLKYIEGDKKTDKMPKVLRDRELRARYGYPSVISY